MASDVRRQRRERKPSPAESGPDRAPVERGSWSRCRRGGRQRAMLIQAFENVADPCVQAEQSLDRRLRLVRLVRLAERRPASPIGGNPILHGLADCSHLHHVNHHPRTRRLLLSPINAAPLWPFASTKVKRPSAAENRGFYLSSRGSLDPGLVSTRPRAPRARMSRAIVSAAYSRRPPPSVAAAARARTSRRRRFGRRRFHRRRFRCQRPRCRRCRRPPLLSPPLSLPPLPVPLPLAEASSCRRCRRRRFYRLPFPPPAFPPIGRFQLRCHRRRFPRHHRGVRDRTWSRRRRRPFPVVRRRPSGPCNTRASRPCRTARPEITGPVPPGEPIPPFWGGRPVVFGLRDATGLSLSDREGQQRHKDQRQRQSEYLLHRRLPIGAPRFEPSSHGYPAVRVVRLERRSRPAPAAAARARAFAFRRPGERRAVQTTNGRRPSNAFPLASVPRSGARRLPNWPHRGSASDVPVSRNATKATKRAPAAQDSWLIPDARSPIPAP